MTWSPFCRFPPESARWLAQQHRYEDTLKSLKKVARINGKRVAAESLDIEVNLPFIAHNWFIRINTKRLSCNCDPRSLDCEERNGK